MNEHLYPPRGGLSDFSIWKDDPLEREKANEPLEDVQDKIWDILKEY